MITGIFLLVVFLADRHYIGIATVVNLICIGYIAEFTQLLLARLPVTQELWMRLLLLAAGIVMNSLAASVYFVADMGVSAYDAWALLLSVHTKLSFRGCRIVTDVICVLIGIFCKTTIGIGTLLTALMMGPIIQLFNERISKPLLYGRKTNN